MSYFEDPDEYSEEMRALRTEAREISDEEA